MMKNKFLLTILPILLLSACGGSSNESSKEDSSSLLSSNDVVVSSEEVISSSQDNPIEFDEDHIIFSSPVFSDEHIGYSNVADGIDNAVILDNAFKTIKSLHPNQTFDAVLSCGDQTQDGKKENVDSFMSVYKSNFDLSDTPFVFAHGNHDTYWTGCMDTTEFYNAYGSEVYKYDLSQNDAKLGNRHLKINGIHFIAVQIKTFMPGYNDFTDYTQTWLDATLHAASIDTPNMPIFVLCHSPAWETVYGSKKENDTGEWGASKQLNVLLADYPNAVLLTGHTHYAPHDETNINQTSFTQINVGSTCDIDLDVNYFDGETVKELDNKTKRAFSFGYFLEVDKYGNTRVTRYDLVKKEKIHNAWIIPSPKDDGSHLAKFNYENRLANNEKPQFPEEGQYNIKGESGASYSFSFDAFQDDDMVVAYAFRIFMEGPDDIDDEDEDYIIELRWMDDWYNYPSGHTGTIDHESGIRYNAAYHTFIVYAVDCFGVMSDGLVMAI